MVKPINVITKTISNNKNLIIFELSLIQLEFGNNNIYVKKNDDKINKIKTYI